MNERVSRYVRDQEGGSFESIVNQDRQRGKRGPDLVPIGRPSLTLSGRQFSAVLGRPQDFDVPPLTTAILQDTPRAFGTVQRQAGSSWSGQRPEDVVDAVDMTRRPGANPGPQALRKYGLGITPGMIARDQRRAMRGRDN